MAALRTSLQDFSLANAVYASATVTVYEADANGAKTVTLATLYDSPAGGSTLANPQTLDSTGKFAAPVYVDSDVIQTVSDLAGGLDPHDTGVVTTIDALPADSVTVAELEPASLKAIGALAPNADRFAYFTSGAAAALATITSFGRSLVAAATAAAARTLLELPTLVAENFWRVNAAGTALESRTAAQVLADIAALPAIDAGSELTIAAGVITPSGSTHTVDTQSNAASDDLDMIDATNLADGALLFLAAEDAARTVVVKHNTGSPAGNQKKIELAGKIPLSLDDAQKWLLLKRRGDVFQEVARADGGLGKVLTVASATTSTQVSSTSGGMTPTGLEVSITKKSATSLLVAFASTNGRGGVNADTVQVAFRLSNMTNAFDFERADPEVTASGATAAAWGGPVTLIGVQSGAAAGTQTIRLNMAIVTSSTTAYAQYQNKKAHIFVMEIEV